MRKYIRGALVLFSAALMITSILLHNLALERRQKLQKITQQLRDDLLNTRLRLARVAQELSQDPVLIESVQAGRKNTYSSKIKSHLRRGEISHVGIYNENCGHFFSSSLDLAEDSYCRPQKEAQLRWFPTPRGKLMVLTRKLGEHYLLSVGVHITEEWLRALLTAKQSASVGIKMKAYRQDQQTMGALLTYPIPHHPTAYDKHPITRHLRSYVAPESRTRFSVLGSAIFFLLSLLLWLISQRKHRLQLASTLRRYEERIAGEALNLTSVGSKATLEGVLEGYQQRLSNMKQINMHRKEQIENLRQSLTSARKRLSSLGYYKALHREIERNAEVFKKSQRQHNTSLADLKDLIEMLQSIAHEHIHTLLSRWNADISTKGPRKFLRSYLEIPSEEKQGESLLERDVRTLLRASEDMTSLRASVHQTMRLIDKQNSYSETLINGWARSSSLSNPTLAEVLLHVVWQLRVTTKQSCTLQRPAWQEPACFPRNLAQVMRCVFYEVLACFPAESALTVHYLSYPTQRLLISTTHLSAQQQAKLRRVQAIAADIGRTYSVRFTAQRSSHQEEGLCYSISWSLPEEALIRTPQQESRSHAPSYIKQAPKDLQP